jgi:hypothetical protein
MNIGITPRTSRGLVPNCFKGIEMLSFKEWLLEEAKKPKKKEEVKDVKSTNQRSSEVRYVYHQGEVDRDTEAIEHQGIHYFPEPKY